MKKYFILAVITAVILGLTSHIYILRLTDSILAKLSTGRHFPTPENYTPTIIFWAYLTAIEQMLITAIIYYFAGGLLKVKNKLYKIIIFSALLLELKGELLRQTVMNIVVATTAGVKYPIIFGIVSQINQWVAGILIITILVFIAPTRKYSDD